MQAILLEKNDSGGNPTGEYVVAFRGTEPNSARDWITNGLTGLYNFNPQVLAGKVFVQEMMNKYSISADHLTLTGHSLGGIITQAVGADLHIQGYAFNPYGANLLNSLPPGPLSYFSLLGQVLDLFGLGAKNDPWIMDNLLNISYQDGGLLDGDILSNLLTNFSKFIAGNDHLGGVLPLFGLENADGIVAGHAMPTLNAALDAYSRILAKFNNPQVDMPTLSTVFFMTGVEKVLRTMAEVAGEDRFGTNRELFDRFVNSSATGLSLALLGDETVDTLRNNASDPGYLYALKNLNPFVITGINYGDLNTDGALDAGSYSPQWLEDRASFLYYRYNKDAQPRAEGSISFRDFTLPDVEAEAVSPSRNHAYYKFGSESGEGIGGWTGDDHLYGQGGDDTLQGLEGNDILDGGKGQDSFFGGEGNDTFVVRGTDTAYDTFNGGDGTDIIRGSAGDDTIRVHEFTAANSVEFIDGGTEGFDVLAGTAQSDTIDLSGTIALNIDEIRGGGGVDFITGGAGDDRIYGEGGGDVLAGGGGENWLYGGAGMDTFIIGAGTDHLYDEDGLAIIKDQQGRTLSGTWQQREDGLYENLATGLLATMNSPFTMQLGDGRQVVLEDFESGDYGISLRDATATGLPLLDLANGPAVYRRYQEDDTAARITAVNGTRDFRISGSNGADEIVTGDGDDEVMGSGGDDTISTGDGADRVFDLAGSTVVETGDGDDIVWGNSPDFDLTVSGPSGTGFLADSLFVPWLNDFINVTLNDAGLLVAPPALDTEGYLNEFHGSIAGAAVDLGPGAANLLAFNGVSFHNGIHDYSFAFDYNESTRNISARVSYSGGGESGSVDLPDGLVGWTFHNPVERVGQLFIDGGAGNDLLYGLKGNDLPSGGDWDDHQERRIAA